MKSKIIDISILIISILFFLSSLFYFIELYSIKVNEEKHLFSKYITNPGIVKLEIFRILSAILILLCTVSKLRKANYGKITTIIIASLILGVLPWLELWYGSTFYYGEMRDKQGLGFPYLPTLYLLYPIWINKKDITKPTILKIATSAGILIFLIIFYNLVYEPWKLWQP